MHLFLVLVDKPQLVVDNIYCIYSRNEHTPNLIRSIRESFGVTPIKQLQDGGIAKRSRVLASGGTPLARTRVLASHDVCHRGERWHTAGLGVPTCMLRMLAQLSQSSRGMVSEFHRGNLRHCA